MKKFLISCVLIAVSFNNAWGQKTDILEPLSLADKVFDLVISLREKCDNFLMEERTNKIKRKLGYLRDDLRRYRLERDDFMSDLTLNNYKLTRGQMKSHTNHIKRKLKKLLVSIDKLDKYLSLDSPMSSGKSTREILKNQLLRSDAAYTELDRLIKGETIDIALIEQNAREISDGLQNSEVSLDTVISSFIK